MRESRSYGSVRGALSNERPYRELFQIIIKGARSSSSKTAGGRYCRGQQSIADVAIDSLQEVHVEQN